MPEPAGDTWDKERRVDRRYPGSAFQSGSLAANATRRQAGQAEVDRPGCDGSLIDRHRWVESEPREEVSNSFNSLLKRRSLVHPGWSWSHRGSSVAFSPVDSVALRTTNRGEGPIGCYFARLCGRHVRCKAVAPWRNLVECQRAGNKMLLTRFQHRSHRPPFTTAPVADSQRSSDPLLFIMSARADSQRRWLSP